MLRGIVFRTHLVIFRRALLGDPPARVEPMAVRLQPGARVVRASPHQKKSLTMECDRVVPQLPLGGDDDRRRGGLGRTGGGGEHLGGGVARLP